jgi:hypothetical protein
VLSLFFSPSLSPSSALPYLSLAPRETIFPLILSFSRDTPNDLLHNTRLGVIPHMFKHMWKKLPPQQQASLKALLRKQKGLGFPTSPNLEKYKKFKGNSASLLPESLSKCCPNLSFFFLFINKNK